MLEVMHPGSQPVEVRPAPYSRVPIPSSAIDLEGKNLLIVKHVALSTFILTAYHLRRGSLMHDTYLYITEVAGDTMQPHLPHQGGIYQMAPPSSLSAEYHSIIVKPVLRECLFSRGFL